MGRRIIPINLDNDEELFNYVASKANRSEFIRYCIRKEMIDEKNKTIDDESLNNRIEAIVKKCLEEYSHTLCTQTNEGRGEQSDEMMAAVNFFDED